MIRINNTQYSHFLQQADVLRRSGSLCDAVISIDNHTFRAHRLVLACASRTLAKKLTQEGDESQLHCTVELQPRTFQQVLDFTYTQALEVSVDDLHLLLSAAQSLGMQSLKEQCQIQLESLDPVRREVREAVDESLKRQRVVEGDVQECQSIQREANTSSDLEAVPHPDTTKGSTSLPTLRKRLKISSMSLNTAIRDGLGDTSSTSSHPPLSPAWTSPRSKRHPVDTLRQMAQNYSSLMAAQTIQPAQHVLAYPLHLPTSYMCPLLASPVPSHLQSSALSYTGMLSPYKHFLASSPQLEHILRIGMVGGKSPNPKAFLMTTQACEQSYLVEPSAQGNKDQQHGSTGLLSSSWQQEPACGTSGESYVGHRCYDRKTREEDTLRPQQQSQSGEKPYECKRCPKRFSLKHQLDTHLRVHTGEKPFECRLCGQRSRDYSAMIKHLRTHGGAMPYRCTACHEFCSSLAAMQRHLKNHAVQDFPPGWNINETYLYISHA